MTPLASRLIERAKIALAAHVHEDQGPNRGVWVHVYQAFAKIPPGAPWCAAAACYWIWKAGQDLGVVTKFPHTGSSSMIVRSARATGNLLPRPEPGCVGVRRGNAYGTGFEHTVIVESVDPDGQHFNTIEGNDSDMVRRDRHAVAGWVFVRVY